MLKQCQATAHHLQHQLSAINDNELPDSVLAAVEAITQQEWFADFNYVTTYLYSAALPEQFADLLKDLQETSRLNDSEIARLRQQ
jgi:ribosome-binding factor A